ncbi:MAG: lipid IV(A) 3-deoxy-D-manno-octulosonic acid transferase [Campylobacterota bacterium]|nr:lipid IV(A) 3-deoxy-D-manno-octulosonic acid transferase [Campylobacterota bacterium]
MKPFTLLYFLLALLLYVAALPLIILLSFKTKYRQSIPARFFLWKNPPFKRSGIWFHVCSLGEARALKPILDRLGEETVNITTTTHTGYAEALKYKADVRYLPYEFFVPFWARSQRVVVVLEAEFWYLLFAVASSRGAKVLLLNARITERSYPKYKKMAWLYRRMFAYVDRVFVQSDADRERFISLGASSVEVVGNIKLAQQITAPKSYEKPECEVIVAASTHETEEEPIIEAYLSYAKAYPSKLIVVPRHPERFDRVWDLITRMAEDHSCSRWSESQNFACDIILVDAMGELNNIYAISDVAVLGGAFKSDVGGHNPLEPARFGCKIITGEHAFMQQELFKYVKDVQIVSPSEIESALEKAQHMPGSHVDEAIDLDRVIEDIKG